MGALFRSEEMTLCQLFLHTDSAYMCISELGELGLVQFRDTVPDTNAFHRKFVNEVRRCDEMERKLRFLEKEIKKDDIPMLDTGDNPDAPAPREMIDLEATFEKLENELKEVNANAEQLKRNFLELSELKQILRKTQSFFDEEEIQPEAFVPAPGMLQPSSNDSVLRTDQVQLESVTKRHPDQAGTSGVEFVAGVILRERLPAFERMLWRACRGNVFLKQAEIEIPLEDPTTGDKAFKSVFIIFFQGDQLRTRVKKICEGFHASLYPCPDSQAERREMAIGVMTRIEDLQTVLNQTQEHRHRVLVAAAKNIKIWFLKVRKIKAIYHTLNLFNLDVTAKCMIGECWCAVDDLDKIHLALRRGTERSNSSVQPILNRMSTREDPPTFNRTDKFTQAFQAIVDAYGVARYREVNPTPFNVISFPFLFAVMFGDAGHGLIMFAFGLWMVLREKQLSAKKTDNEIWNTFFGGRYIIMLMGAFSIYTGLIYNDVFSKSLNIFGSSWKPNFPNTTVAKVSLLQLNPGGFNTTAGMYLGYPYPFGVDPVWQSSKNKITFLNSVKMKMSIILGVSHMLFGLSLSFFNHRFYKDRLAIYCEFLPQLIFLTAIFGYLIILIFAKWIAFDGSGAACAPSLLIGLINMFMFSYSDSLPCAARPFYKGQGGLQSFLVVLAVACVPWMLLVKPLILRKRHLAQTGNNATFASNTDLIHVSHESGEDNAAHDEVNQNGSRSSVTEPHGAVHAEEEVVAAEGAPVDAAGLSVQSGDIMNGRAQPDDYSGHPPGGAGVDSTMEAAAAAAARSASMAAQPTPHHEEFDFTDIFVHQCIHTIEYCLGCISNTASYLRLWALSLAHAQLSEVLWSMVLRVGLNIDGYYGSIVLFAVFGAWACLTLTILLVMEGLSAFLHALRLHWIEFQNKFYAGTGYAFVPFKFDHYTEVRTDE